MLAKNIYSFFLTNPNGWVIINHNQSTKGQTCRLKIIYQTTRDYSLPALAVKESALSLMLKALEDVIVAMRYILLMKYALRANH